MEPLMAYLHYVAIIATAGFLVAEMAVCRPGLGAAQLAHLARLDALYFASALAALATGLLRLFFYAKGVDFYLPNPFFWAKMAVYVAIAIISIGATRRFLRWRKALAAGGPPPGPGEIEVARRLVHVELGLLVLLPLFAVLMARGIGR
ncbi:MAG: DUF2214 family protein [Candidatus Rokubacteria bacterium]|nr:DUF2214 family protein [Candidatus Rokubacteria bacterium]